MNSTRRIFPEFFVGVISEGDSARPGRRARQVKRRMPARGCRVSRQAVIAASRSKSFVWLRHPARRIALPKPRSQVTTGDDACLPSQPGRLCSMFGRKAMSRARHRLPGAVLRRLGCEANMFGVKKGLPFLLRSLRSSAADDIPFQVHFFAGTLVRRSVALRPKRSGRYISSTFTAGAVTLPAARTRAR